MKLPRLDTLFLRLFVLMWATLIASHLLAFAVSIPLTTGGQSPALRLGWIELLSLPSLPPGNLLSGEPPPPGSAPAEPQDRPPMSIRPAGAPNGLPPLTLWTDYALRALLIGLGAWWGARWLSRPMQRLANAARALPQDLEQGRHPPALDEHQGTVEVRESAHVFNQMARQLQQQFDQRSLHMAAVSHDLRTPLTRLRLRVEQLPGPVATSASADIREMDELINASLTVMREQASGEAPSLVDLCALLQAMVDDLLEQGQPIELAHEAQGNEAAGRINVRVRPASLRRALGNLLSNALRYGHRAHLRLHPMGNRIAVMIDDEGPGIAESDLERVFEPWVRLPGESRVHGSGLGLAIARDLVHRDGGTLTLHNLPTGGLRATLSLPQA